MIHTSNLKFSYEKEPVLQDVSLSIEKGECVGIIGPNGGGKTTLLKLLMGFLTPVSGKIRVLGKRPQDARESIGYVPQYHNVDRDFPVTTEQLILLGALSKASLFGKYPKAVLRKAEDLMEELGLLAHRKKTFGSLSGGLAQRALLARALISEPEILLLDEPTANVDPISSQIILKKLFRMKGEKTILFVTHQLKMIAKDVDRVLCVQSQVFDYEPQSVCEHFAMGLYHPKEDLEAHATP
jgi:zinc transport system ATP-binding protein